MGRWLVAGCAWLMLGTAQGHAGAASPILTAEQIEAAEPVEGSEFKNLGRTGLVLRAATTQDKEGRTNMSMQNEDHAWIKSFISLGDNCELGFIQRHFGYDQGGLLKWARIMNIDHLITFLKTPQENFYKFDHLVPAWSDMVTDTSSGIQFHSVLRSEAVDGQRNFVDDEARRKVLYKEENSKRVHLFKKFMAELRDPDLTLVFKMNSAPPLAKVKELDKVLRDLGNRANLLHLVQNDRDKAGQVEKITDTLYVGYIRKFAPYVPVTDNVPEYWVEVLQAYRAIAHKKHVTNEIKFPAFAKGQ